MLRKEKHISLSSNEKSSTEISNIVIPNNDKLLSYFKERGISKEILQENTQQIHFSTGEKIFWDWYRKFIRRL